MTTSEAFVWTWLPGATQPVVAGQLRRSGGQIDFAYGRSYLDRPDAISLYGPELPLRPGRHEPPSGMVVASCLRDGEPDAWGRRVLRVEYAGDPAFQDDDDIAVMLRSGSNRFGANDFQASPEHYVARERTAPMADLLLAAEALMAGDPLPEGLAAPLGHGTSIGGARPKILVRDNRGEWIGKLSTSTDRMNVVGAEAAAMFLARAAGIKAASSHVQRVAGRDILMVQRFDRTLDGQRRHCVSGLTMLGLDETIGRYATYPDLLALLRRDGKAADVGSELFDRIAFNIAVGNNDDHARNHAAFWDGEWLELTPAYDLAPQPRSGETSSQAMAYGRDGRRESSLHSLAKVGSEYGVSHASERVDQLVESITTNWEEAADHAGLAKEDRGFLWGRQILNPAVLRRSVTAG